MSTKMKIDDKLINTLADRIENRKRKETKIEKYDKKKSKSEKCGNDENKTLYTVTFNYKSKQVSGDKFFPVTYRNFNRKLGELTENLKVGDIVRYEPRKQNKNFGLEAKILEIKNYDKNKNSYKISFLNPLLGSSKILEGILQYEQYKDNEENQKTWKNLVKVNKIHLYFCENPTTSKIHDLIKKHLETLINFTFLRHKYPKKIQKISNKKSRISFWIPEKSKPNEKRLIRVNNTSIIVKIPPKFKVNEYITLDIDPNLNSEFYSKEIKKDITQKINPIRFIPSYIFSQNANKINTKIGRKDLIKTPKDQLYTISSAKIVKNLGEKFIVTDGKPGYKDIIVNVELTLNLKTLLSKGQTTNITNQIHDFIMNNSKCALAKVKLREGIERATTPMLITEAEKKSEEEAKEKKRRMSMLRNPLFGKKMPEFRKQIEEEANKRKSRRIGGGKRRKKKKTRKKKGSGKQSHTKYLKKQIALKKQQIKKIKKNLKLNPEEIDKKKEKIDRLTRNIKNKTNRLRNIRKRGGKRTHKK